MKILSRVGIGLFLLLLILILVLNGCMSFRTSDKKLKALFEEQNVDVKIHHKDFNNREIRYIETGLDQPPSAPLVIFVHGAPGSLDAFNQYLADSLLLEKARMVAVDRLGYGYSDYGQAETDIGVQADQIAFIAKQYQSEKIILLGHSYGGPIVGKCVMTHPNMCKGIIMLAPVNNPGSEPIFWFANFAKWPLTRWMLPKAFVVSGDEKFAHIEELKKIKSGWPTIKIPVVHIHGDEDSLAPPDNMDYSEIMIDSAYLKVVKLEETDHFIPWSDYELVRTELLQMLE